VSSGDPDPDGSHGPHVLVADVADPVLAGRDRRHLTGSLRLRDGDPLTVGDGRGSWVECKMASEPRPVGTVRRVERPSPDIGVAFALIKGGRPETVVRRLTELGIDRIIPFTAARSIVKWDVSRAAHNVERFRRVVREAVMQCRRAWLPVVDDVMSFDDVVALSGCAMADMTGAPVATGHRVLMVGPEGGWTDAERAVDVPKVRIASPVLRTETAAVAAGTLLSAVREGLVSPVPDPPLRSA